jgi:asparagine synthase (glutamine-hydrolysing)
MEWVETLEKLFVESVEKACEGQPKIAVLFSSGVDSALVSYVACRFSEVTAYNVGVQDSKDQYYSKKAGQTAPFKIKYATLSEDAVEEILPEVVSISKSTNPIDAGVGMPFYCASKMASEDGFHSMLCGQGSDELFGGYNRYLEALVEVGEEHVISMMEKDYMSAYDDNLLRDMAMCSANNVELGFPYLDPPLSEYIRNLPFELKIRKDADIECDMVGSLRFARKYALKKLAIKIGLPDYLVNRPKKAAQYGSGIHKTLDKISRKRGYGEKAKKQGRKDHINLYLESVLATVSKKDQEK